MKRFYKEVAARADANGHAILLDGRPVRTPAKAALEVPTPQLAEAIVGEWEAQGDTIDPRSMPLTGLANAAIDRVAPELDAFVRGLAAYGESDLLCYRADTPGGLVARQAEHWDPLLAWSRRRFDVDFEVVHGIMHRDQPATTIDRLRKAVEARDAFALAGLSPLITIPGSLIIALALAEGEIDVDTAWAATTVDEAWQIEQWGEDRDEMQRLEARRREFEAAHRFLRLLS
jgi:chaperone required for assembly of F1-ATPase